MPKVKVPKRLQQLAAELELDLGGEIEFTNHPDELIAWMQDRNEELRSEETQQRDEISTELDNLESEMMEQIDDHA